MFAAVVRGAVDSRPPVVAVAAAAARHRVWKGKSRCRFFSRSISQASSPSTPSTSPTPSTASSSPSTQDYKGFRRPDPSQEAWDAWSSERTEDLPDWCDRKRRSESSTGLRGMVGYRNMSVTFLGTSSGGGPTETRNCSSLVCDVLGNSTLWLLDCAEGTVRQFMQQPRVEYPLRLNKVSKIFITHMHADHIIGLVPFLRNILFPPPSSSSSPSSSSNPRPPRIHIYGPSGIRKFVRQNMKMTRSFTADTYTVHELLAAGDKACPCIPVADPEAADAASRSVENEAVMHPSEIAGMDIRCDEDGLWRAFTSAQGVFSEVVVDAGPIVHRDPCLGYVIRETVGSRRKLVLLGDTSDASAIIPLCVPSPPANSDPDPDTNSDTDSDMDICLAPSLVVHEATDAFIPRHVDPAARRSRETVRDKALARGHSTPDMAGAFARRVGAERLVLNHISGRFPAPKSKKDIRAAVIREIERQASEAWGSDRRAVAAYDYLRVVIPPPALLAAPRLPQADVEMAIVVDEEMEETLVRPGEGTDEGRKLLASARNTSVTHFSKRKRREE